MGASTKRFTAARGRRGLKPGKNGSEDPPLQMQIRRAGGASPASTARSGSGTRKERWRGKLAATSSKNAGTVDRRAFAGDNSLSALLLTVALISEEGE